MFDRIQFNVVYLEKNKGLGNALKEALLHCNNDLVARMDSDDISMEYRFEKQLDEFISNPDLDIVGGPITEFDGNPDSVIGIRDVELKNDAIIRDMKKRCAINHVSVMYKKQSVEKAGGYIDWYYNEDYYLWIRMMECGCKFGNVSYPLVNVRVGNDMAARRGGWKYFKSEQLLQKYMLKQGIISIPRYLYNICLRFGGEVLVSNRVRQLLYKILRKHYNSGQFVQSEKKNSMKKYPPFSVATSVYKNDNPEWFDLALDSIIVNQTVKPSEVVLVVDGPVPDTINQVIQKYIRLCTSAI